MIQRCENPRSQRFARYGGRGISVCSQWRQSFETFQADMGPRPSERHSLDRINNDGNYEPGNCRWATPGEQNRNTRRTRMVTFGGETMCMKDWSDRLGISWRTLDWRLKRYPVDVALTMGTR